MTQMMTVQHILDEKHAVVGMERANACSGDCHQCQGCGTVGQTITAVARNPIGAAVGDVVTVKSSSAAVLTAVVLVYLLPLVLFFIGYGLGTALPWRPVLWGGIGFALGIGLAICYHRHVQRRGTLLYEICAVVRRAE